MLETSVTTESSKIVARTDTSRFANSESTDSVSEIRMTAENVDVYYTDTHAIKNVNISIRANEVLAIIGPSGCGKSTFLRCLNRINDIIDGCRITGRIKLDGKDIYGSDMDVVELRARVGMVFQKPNPFPKSIYDNIAYGPRLHSLVGDRAERMKWSIPAFRKLDCFRKWRIESTSLELNYRVVSSNVYVSHERLQFSLK